MSPNIMQRRGGPSQPEKVEHEHLSPQVSLLMLGRSEQPSPA
ncbi:MAG: hypothetical protein WA960_12385 [Tunicatimonas sp.]